ncbi:MAG: XRE family transcriptional regulator [Rhodovulum sulfidophilum]|uniref:XRE family transcriptional regulator n=1 Tax=Rhodovulum sulfidophilum TaxID=35806 RepID=A0A2W5MXE0_RHOSU|nr:MAG: XRE family transcriptional regulator [Rhodovulum sulfidophilum]
MSSSEQSDGVFAERLKAARESRNMSQSELARKLQMVPSAIAHFEANRRKPSFANIRSIAKALNVSSDYLLGRAPSLEGATTVFRGEEKLTDEDREFIQQMINLRTQARKSDG